MNLRSASCTAYSMSCPVRIATLLLRAWSLHVALLLRWAALIATRCLRAILTHTLLLLAAGCWCGSFCGLLVLGLLCLLLVLVLTAIL